MLPVQQAIVDHLLIIALLILVKPHQPLLMTALLVTSTASMEELLEGFQGHAPAPVQQTLVVPTVRAVQQATVEQTAQLSPAKPHLALLMTDQMGTTTASMEGM